MNIELQNKLFKKYPKIFAEKDLPMNQTCMCWGIECGDGWYWLIDKLCRSLQWRIDYPPSINGEQKKVPQVVASQVKEKYGSLRFYTNGATSEQHAIISFAELLSGSICEECGSTKDIGWTRGWITILCKECATKLKVLDNWGQESDNEDDDDSDENDE